MTKLKFSGKVESGKGRGRHFISIPWVQKQILEHVGFNAYPGTLNLRIDEETARRYHEIFTSRSLLTIRSESESNYDGYLIEVMINRDRKGAIVIPRTPDYPRTLVELISAEYLRKVYGLTDGDTVEVSLL
jgi:riboflavin kinase